MVRCNFCGAPEHKCTCLEGQTDVAPVCTPPEEESVLPFVPTNPDDDTNETASVINNDLENVRGRLTVAEQVIEQQRKKNEDIQRSLHSAESALLDCQRKYDQLEIQKNQIMRSISEGKSHEIVIESKLELQRKIAQKAQEDLKSVRTTLDSWRVKYERKLDEMTSLQNEMERVQNDLSHTRAQLKNADPPAILANERANNLQMVAYGVALGVVISLLILIVIMYKIK